MSALNKEEFCKITDGIRDRWSVARKMDDLNRSLGRRKNEFFNGAAVMSINDDDIIFILEKMYDDEQQWISYFCFELNFGEEWTENSVREKDGTSIPLKTSSDLYDLIKA